MWTGISWLIKQRKDVPYGTYQVENVNRLSSVLIPVFPFGKPAKTHIKFTELNGLNIINSLRNELVRLVGSQPGKGL